MWSSAPVNDGATRRGAGSETVIEGEEAGVNTNMPDAALEKV